MRLARPPAEDVSRVVPGLYQGSWRAPYAARALWGLRFDLHVACAMEHTPHPGTASRVVHLELDDDPWKDCVADHGFMDAVTTVAADVAETVLRGDQVLATCAMGLNRSGLVVGLALLALGNSADTAIRLVRRARGRDALGNPRFVEAIRAVAAVGAHRAHVRNPMVWP